MKQFSNLAKILKKIDVTSKKIIDETLKLMNQIQNEDSELVDDLAEFRGLEEPFDRAKLLEGLQNSSMFLSSDAETVRNEIENFMVEDDGVFVVNADHEVCPFLSEVWNGDSYDKTGIDGLKELLKDLESQLLLVTSEKLVETTSKMTY